MVNSTSKLEISIHDTLTRDIKYHRSWFTGLGIVFLILGSVAIIFPWAAALSVDIIIALLLLVAGITQMLQSFFIPRWRGFLPSIGLSVIAIIAGALMVFFPQAGVMTLTTLVMLFLFLSGGLKTFFALQVRPAVGWGWILFSGLMSLALGFLILLLFTQALPWVLGVLLGVDFIVTGAWMLALAAIAKKV